MTTHGTLRFSLGSVGIELSSNSGELLRLAKERYGRFPSTGKPRLVVKYTVAREAPASLISPLEVRTEALRESVDGERLGAEGRTFALDFDLGAGRAEIAGPQALYPLEYLIRCAVPALLDGGLLLHGAALAHDGKGWACCGVSDAGKTTLAGLVGSRALCDELTAVEDSDAGFRMRSTPYWNGRPGQAVLREVCVLTQSPRHRKTKLSPGQAVRRLAPLVLWPTHFPRAGRRTMNTLCDLASRVPVSELRFAPRSDVWDTIAAEV